MVLSVCFAESTVAMVELDDGGGRIDGPLFRSPKIL